MKAVKRALVLPLLGLYAISGIRATLDRDVRKRVQPTPGAAPAPPPSTAQRLDALWAREFRSVFYSRLRHRPAPIRALARLARLFWRPQIALDISCDDIGPGLTMLHGFATIIAAERIGEDCLISHNVTIGHGHGGAPTIGDRVHIMPGAIVTGGFHVGDNAIVGAGAVVVNEVPAGATVVGVPAKVISESPWHSA